MFADKSAKKRPGSGRAHVKPNFEGNNLFGVVPAAIACAPRAGRAATEHMRKNMKGSDIFGGPTAPPGPLRPASAASARALVQGKGHAIFSTAWTEAGPEGGGVEWTAASEGGAVSALHAPTSFNGVWQHDDPVETEEDIETEEEADTEGEDGFA